MDESDAKATLAEIETVGGSKHEAWIKGDPAVLSERENLYQKMYPNPVESNSPPPPALANVNNSSQPAVSQPPATAGEPPTDTTPDDSQVCEDHLRQQWGEAYEAN